MLVLLAASEIRWTDVWTAYGTVGAAIAAVVGVVAALVLGAVIAPWLANRSVHDAEQRQRERDSTTEEHRFRTAALLVRDELKANLAILEVALQTRSIPETLAYETYRDLQLLLGEHMKASDRNDVRAAYVYPRTPRVFYTTVGPGSIDVPLAANIEAARKKTERAIAVLGWIAEELPGGYNDL